jgi:hypothetical protein
MHRLVRLSIPLSAGQVLGFCGTIITTAFVGRRASLIVCAHGPGVAKIWPAATLTCIAAPLLLYLSYSGWRIQARCYVAVGLGPGSHLFERNGCVP